MIQIIATLTDCNYILNMRGKVMINNIKKEQCTGCKMCSDVCPVDAITYPLDKEGFWYPDVDYSKCIKCQNCIKSCPSLTKIDFKKNKPEVYSGWINNTDIRLKSTSGGMYYAMASYFINSRGYIVGSRYTDNYKGAKHIYSNTIEGLNQVMGSKYFQSDAKGIYLTVKKLLEEGKKVLFCGTPCQGGALQSFLKKDYNNLVIADFICRGVNSPMVFKSYMEELENEYNSEIEFVHLKNKKNGWTSLATLVKFKNGSEYYKDKNNDLWVKGFIKGNLYMRPSCHNCKYKKLPRIADITIGDFWGIQGADSKDMFNGISVIMVNSEKGKSLITSIKDSITLEEQSLESAIKGNPCILTSAQEGTERNRFFKLLEKYPFTTAVQMCFTDK